MTSTHPRAYQYFDELAAIHYDQRLTLTEKVRKQRTCLEKVCKTLSRDDGLTFPNLQARLDYVCNKAGVTAEQKGNLHTFRIKANKVIHEDVVPEPVDYYLYLKILAEGFAGLLKGKVPPDILKLYKGVKTTARQKQKYSLNSDGLRGVVRAIDRTNKIISVLPDDGDEQPVKVRYDVKDVNEELTSSLEYLKEGDLIQLLRIFKDENGHYVPGLIVLQPDYLLDVTAIAGCFLKIKRKPVKAYEFFFLGRSRQRELTLPIHQGNVANLFFDEIVNESPSKRTDYQELLVKSFRDFPLAYTALTQKEEAGKEFSAKLKAQYDNIRQAVENDFRRGDHQPINRDACNLEVFLISHELGIQGRMDLFDETPSSNEHYTSKILELKSGENAFVIKNPSIIDESHATQVRMYNMLTSLVLGHDPRKIFNAVFYSAVSTSGQSIRYVSHVRGIEREIINIRNQIVAREFLLADDDEAFGNHEAFLNGIGPEKHGLDGDAPKWILDKFLDFKGTLLKKVSPLEKQYYFAFSAFISREKILSKVGDGEYTKGLSALWNKDDLADEDVFNHLRQLSIAENQAHKPAALIKLKRPEGSNRFANFRRGDICVLFPDVKEKPLAVHHRVLKCTISSITNDEVEVRLRQQQSSLNYFEAYEAWALEHDALDNQYEQMHRGLFEFLKMPVHKKELLLGLRKPESRPFSQKTFVDEEKAHSPADSIHEQNRVLSKAWLATDYFLLVGPPGTGKTNNFLFNLVKSLIYETDLNILLVSYTNRAVDEMCGSVRGIVNDGLIRIGSSLGCDAKYKELMLDEKVKGLKGREDIRNLIRETRVFTGTLSSIQGRTELFDLKKFDIAIVDEASQILEPNIVNLLGRVEKFVLIGDERQLPAVVTQQSSESYLRNSDLNDIGLLNRRNSYFERLLYLCKKNRWNHAWGELTFQGRMHPSIVDFPNQLFYNNKLKPAERDHQKKLLSDDTNPRNDFEKFLVSQRMIYIPSEPSPYSASEKSSQQEAEVISKVLQSLARAHNLNDDEIVRKIGIITPYRNQIACIRQQLEKDGVDCFESVQVDTVERFQGSQKDFILISLCVNSPGQMDFMSAARVTVGTDDGESSPTIIDRKLNVTLTRARKQIVLTGLENVLTNDVIYSKLIDYVKVQGGYVEEGAPGVLSGAFVLSGNSEPSEDVTSEAVPPSFVSAWQQIVANPVFAHPETSEKLIMGHPADLILNVGTEFGRADFDKPSAMFRSNGGDTHFTAHEKVLLYGQFHLRNYYMAVFNLANRLREKLQQYAHNAGGRVTIIDFGGGPATAGLALTDALEKHLTLSSFNYVGIEPSSNMRELASAFLEHESYRRRPYYRLMASPDGMNTGHLAGIFERPNLVLFSFSYVLEQLDMEALNRFAEAMANIRDHFPQNKYCALIVSTPAAGKMPVLRQFKNLFQAVDQTEGDVFSFSYPLKHDGSKYKKVRYYGDFVEW
ncbi:MAG: AAA domain-containing protein [Marinilabiliaceae bacterium]